ncbi:RPT6A [Symbiodinium sp. CCMP2592]|nr:RPT6A [Symbiodinium sp. CCMP2592]
MEPEVLNFEESASSQRKQPPNHHPLREKVRRGDHILLVSFEKGAFRESRRPDQVRFLGGFVLETVEELEANVLQKDFARMLAEWQQFVTSFMRRKDTAQSKDVETKNFCKWSVSRSFFATEEKLLGKASLTGGQMQKVTTLTSPSLIDAVSGWCYDHLAAAGEQIRYREFATRHKAKAHRVLIVPAAVGQEALEFRGRHARSLISPKCLTSALGIVVDSVRAAPEPESVAVAAGNSNTGVSQREDVPVDLHLFYACVAHHVQNLQDIPDIMQMVGTMLLPSMGLEPANVPVPKSKKTFARDMIKLDLIHTWSNRIFNKAGDPRWRRARYLGSDSSPQGGYDYFAVTEDVLERSPALDFLSVPEEQFDAFGGFTWHRRTLPLTALARGHGSASMKFCRLLHVLHQEQGAENIDMYRSEVKGYLSDQGTEKHLFGFPYEKNATLNSLARGLLSGDVQLDEVGNTAFLHNAYGIPGVMHILFNALESALKTSPETELRAAGRVFSQKSYVDLVLQFTPGLSAADQELIRGLDVAVLDWRWESIEYCAKYWKQVIRAALGSTKNRAMTLWTSVLSGAAIPFENGKEAVGPSNGSVSNGVLACVERSVSDLNNELLKFDQDLANEILRTDGLVRQNLEAEYAAAAEAGHHWWSHTEVAATISTGFVEIQERAWCPMAERFLESQHRGIKWAFRRGFTKAKPAVTCARLRRNQVLQMVTSDGDRRLHVMQQWARRSSFQDLLCHVLSPTEIAGMSEAKRLSRVYCYSLADHFHDVDDMEVAAEAFKAAAAAAITNQAASGPVLKPGHRQRVSFLKQQLSNGTLCSFPRSIFELLSADDEPEEEDKEGDDAEDDVDDDLLSEALGDEEFGLPDLVPGGTVYCQVIDARPENRASVKQGLAEDKGRNGMLVQIFSDVRPITNVDGVCNRVEVCGSGSSVTMLNLSRACTRDLVLSMFQQVCVWSAESAGMRLEIQSGPAGPEEDLFPALPDINAGDELVDDDMKLDVFVQQVVENSLVAQADILSERQAGKGLSVGSAAAYLSQEERQVADALVNAGALGSTEISLSRLSAEHNVAMSHVLRLCERGLIAVRFDDFGDAQVALVAPFLLQPKTFWGDPLPLSHARVELLNRSRKKGTNKLEFVRALVRSGWRWLNPGQDTPEQISSDDVPGCLPKNVLTLTESHLKALFLAPWIFQKPGKLPRMFHEQKQAYYEYLLAAADLGSIAHMSQSDITAFFSKDKAAGWRVRGLAQRLRDESDVSGDEGEQRPVLEDLKAFVMSEAIEANEPSALHPDLRQAPVQSRVPGLDCKIYFHNFSHESGKLRAFCQCPYHRDKRCRLYLFVEHLGRSETVAKLLAWASMEAASVEEHLRLRPTQAQIDCMLHLQSI